MLNPESLKRWVDETFAQRIAHYSTRLASLDDLTDLRNADDQTRQDYAGRFAFELLQNGADAHDKAVRAGQPGAERGKGRVSFVLTESCMLVGNSGAAFSHLVAPGEPLSSLESISRLGESTKRGGEYIGNKGIGFRSIYQVCSRLWLISGGYRIRYDGEATYQALLARLRASRGRSGAEDVDALLERLMSTLPNDGRWSERIPMMKAGAWFEWDDLGPTERHEAQRLLREGYATVLVLDRGSTTEEASRSFSWSRVEQLSERELLFLDTLAEVHAADTTDPNVGFSLRMSGEGRKRTVERAGARPATTHFWIDRFPIRDLEHQRAAIAFRLDPGGLPVPAPIEDRVFYTFYPASRERHGFPFYLHSAFLLGPSREYFNPEAGPTRRNLALLDDLAAHLISVVVPELLTDYPACRPTALLLPRIEPGQQGAVADFLKALQSHATESDNTAVGALSARFCARLLQHLRECAIVPTSRTRCSPTRVRLPPAAAAGAWDALQTALGELGSTSADEVLPVGATALLAEIEGLGALAASVFIAPKMTTSLLVSRLGAVGVEFSVSPHGAAAVLALLDALPTDAQDFDGLLEPLRVARTPILPCGGVGRMLPKATRQGVPVQPGPDSPLVFVRAATVDESEEIIEIPAFCHVHVLDEAVVGAGQAVGWSGSLRDVARRRLGLPEFAPEEVCRRIAQSMYGGAAEAPLTPHQRWEILKTTLRLIARRLRGALERNAFDEGGWFARSTDDSDWQLHYWLARSWIPVAQGWHRGRDVILAGALGAGGALRTAYPSEQVFLDEETEDPDFRTLLDGLFDAAQRRPEDDDPSKGRPAFRAHVYRMLGAWNSVRFDVVHHASGYRDPRTDPLRNPHDCISAARWATYLKTRQSGPFSSYAFTACHLIRSAALPHADALAAALHSGQAVLAALHASRRTISQLAMVELRSPANSRADVQSLLALQLRDLPWIAEERDASGQRIWYTQSRTLMRTDPQKEAHYLRSVTAAMMDEALATALGFQVLETPGPTPLAAYIELYCETCARVRTPPAGAKAAGRGLETLYRTIVEKVQRLLLGPQKAAQDELDRVKKEFASPLARLRKAGILVHAPEGLRHLSTPTAGHYDNLAEPNSLFRKHLALAAFGPDCAGFAALLGVPLLTEAHIVYDDGSCARFVGHGDVEASIGSTLVAMRPALFAFLLHSDTIPASQRMAAESTTFVNRWRDFSALRVEVFRELGVTIAGAERWTVDGSERVVLEHAPQQGSTSRRVFMRDACVDNDGRVDLKILAGPLTSLLGANRLALATLLGEMSGEEGDPERLERFVVNHCGVTRGQIVELYGTAQREDEALASRAQASLALISALFGADAQTQQIQSHASALLTAGVGFHDLPMRQMLVNAGLTALHLRELGFGPLAENERRFRELRLNQRQCRLVAAAVAVGISEPGGAWEALFRSYDMVAVDSLTVLLPAADEDALEKPIQDWSLINGALLPGDRAETSKIWERLTGDPESAKRLLQENFDELLPWLVAAASSVRAATVEDLASSAGLDESVKAALEAGDVAGLRNSLFSWLADHGVSRSLATELLHRFPKTPDPSSTEIAVEEVERVRRLMQQAAARRGRRADRLISAYREGIEAALSRGEFGAEPKNLVLACSAAASGQPVQPSSQESVGFIPGTPSIPAPRKRRRRSAPQEHLLLKGFEQGVTGRCGEEFALLVQRQRWGDAAIKDPDAAREHLRLVGEHYCDDEAWVSALVEELLATPPGAWTLDPAWAKLRQLLHMAGADAFAPYDIVGLDRESLTDTWSVYRIEVKASTSASRLEFPMSAPELRESEDDPTRYVIWRVRAVGAGRSPNWFRLPNPTLLVSDGRLIRQEAVFLLCPVLATS